MIQKLRKKAFWTLDKLKGSKVEHHYKSLKDVLENDQRNKSDLKQTMEKELIKHAVNTTDFYENFKGTSDLERFPIINKSSIRDQYDAFISRAYSKSERTPVVTSGSTGTPFKVYHDENKIKRNTADTLFFANKAGYQIGDCLIYLKIWAKEKMASSFHYKMQNMMPIDVIKLDDDQISALISKIESQDQTYSILGYVSALETICRFLDRSNSKKINADVSSIITMSEAPTPYVKERMEYYFDTEVMSRYSNSENGILAQQIPGSNGRYLINSASYIIEVLNSDSDEPVKIGEPGRIVITDLFNYAMPMIRYDIGDIGVLSEKSDIYDNLYFEKIEGRKLDLLYDTKGEIISSYIMYKNMWKYTEIKQYQLIQEGPKEYRFKINIDGEFEKELELVNEFKQYIGNDAGFKVEYVDEIPLLSSGKRKKTVNNWK